MRWVWLVMVLAGCASPPVNLYVLAARPGGVMHAPARSIGVHRIGVAAYLDRPQIVRATAEFRMQVVDGERWGEPLGRMLDRVLTENLVQRLPEASIFSESGAIQADPDIILEVDVQRFDADADGTVTLLAQVAVRRAAGGRAVARTVRLTSVPAGPGTPALVAALSAVWAEFSNTVATMLAARI